MDIIEKAKELGQAIANSEEMNRLKQAEADIENDEKARELLNDYKQLQIEVVRATKEGREKAVVDSIKDRLLDKQEEINLYETTKRYIDAKSSFDGFMKTINNVMIYSITGEEPCSPTKCGTCGGCK